MPEDRWCWTLDTLRHRRVRAQSVHGKHKCVLLDTRGPSGRMLTGYSTSPKLSSQAHSGQRLRPWLPPANGHGKRGAHDSEKGQGRLLKLERLMTEPGQKACAAPQMAADGAPTDGAGVRGRMSRI